MAEIRDEAIKELIPQRDPIIMIDAFWGATESEADTGFTIAKENLFCCNDQFTEPGLIEHIAQSASAFAGYKAKVKNEPTPIGYIGEVKKFRIHFLPHTGDELRTHIRILSEVLGISLLTAETKVNGEVAAQCQMKIFIKPS
ncbi:MAG: hydroxymyristoyl-ACP dehydratase [Tannerella sp.]|jgi:3-hydroxymyristoyl/3-hydroxydecanoyl-(acyl carrier protein) dehydratase|nr:hydroxymyristoyl-ACP dehydratase [Tannerella sp.]